jgi:hypothetical protein
LLRLRDPFGKPDFHRAKHFLQLGHLIHFWVVGRGRSLDPSISSLVIWMIVLTCVVRLRRDFPSIPKSGCAILILYGNKNWWGFGRWRRHWGLGTIQKRQVSNTCTGTPQYDGRRAYGNRVTDTDIYTTPLQ